MNQVRPHGPRGAHYSLRSGDGEAVMTEPCHIRHARAPPLQAGMDLSHQ
jgi:hypothetical protein